MIVNVPRRRGAMIFVVCLGAVAGVVWAADAPLTPAAADLCAKKAIAVSERGTQARGAGARRTTFTEQEINSYLTLRAGSSLPPGLSKASIGMPGQGQVTATVVVDLDVVGKTRAPGGSMEVLSLLGGRVPVTLRGTLRARNGTGTFELQDADVSGFPVPARLLQELLSYYTKTPARPGGYRIDDAFALPYGIRTIEVGVGQAVVVQ